MSPSPLLTWKAYLAMLESAGDLTALAMIYWNLETAVARLIFK